MSEINFDKELPRLATELSNRSSASYSPFTLLQTKCVWLYEQLRRDAVTPNLFQAWGECVNQDEIAGGTIVDPAILATIGTVAGIPMTGPRYHAGLQHTYGYLFSVIQTPYGYKRDRWISTRLERGFGLSPDTLSPAPTQGTLLANATYLAGNIATRGSPVGRRCIDALNGCVAEDLLHVPFDQLRQSRLIEKAAWNDDKGKARRVRIQTDLVPFPRSPENEGESVLLIYSVGRSRQPPRLVTLFTVTQSFADSLTASERLGDDVEIVARFNAWVDGLTGTPRRGQRTVRRFR